MAMRVRGDRFGDPGLSGCQPDCLLNDGAVERLVVGLAREEVAVGLAGSPVSSQLVQEFRRERQV